MRRYVVSSSLFCIVIACLLCHNEAQQSYGTDCSNLRMGQYICPDPDYNFIDPATQQPRGCTKENKAKGPDDGRINLPKRWHNRLLHLTDPQQVQPIHLLKRPTSHQSFYGTVYSVVCRAADGIICFGTGNSTFKKEIPCKWTNGYSFETALLLSIFLGMFGADRFYLGYPAMGLLKFCTLGFMFLGQLVDVILIATQVVGPADGSQYVIPYYGAGVTIIKSNNWTYRLPQNDW